MAWEQSKLEEHMKSQFEHFTKHGTKKKGKAEILSHFQGKRLTMKQAIAAQCYQCMGGHQDGEKEDCMNPPCPLYPYMPYNPNRDKRVMSEEQRKASSERLRISRTAR